MISTKRSSFRLNIQLDRAKPVLVSIKQTPQFCFAFFREKANRSTTNKNAP